MSIARRFGRRTEDYTKQVMVARLLTFTDLMAVLLSFFVLLYATRDPASAPKISLAPPIIAPIVAPTPQPALKLSKDPGGLDLSYVAALLTQAQTRDPILANATITTTDGAVIVRLKENDPVTIGRVLDLIERYQRRVELFAPIAIVEQLMVQKSVRNRLYFPQDGKEVFILVH